MEKRYKEYWRRNIRLLFLLLTIWFIVSFGFGILFVEQLNQFHIGGAQLGFWFAQQGSIIVFVFLILYYVIRMKKLDKEFDVDD